jgi:glyoxylase-like metal-dependent hydrolase (beta-lactamase superfamily II)
MASNGIDVFRLGALEGFSMLDSAGPWPGGAAIYFLNAAPALLEEACRRHGTDVAQLPLMAACLYLDTGTHRVLLDTGMGPNPDPTCGRLLERLQSVGIERASIDTVILSHWHFDHVWGCTLEDGQLAFPNARYAMWKSDWEWATTEANLPLMQEGGGERSRTNLLAIRWQPVQ